MNDTIETTVTCPKCDAAIAVKYSPFSPEKAIACSACGASISLPKNAPELVVHAQLETTHAAPIMPSFRPPQSVVITDIRMSFGSMVVFMLKWALASIPAAFVLASVFFLVFGMLILGGCAAILNLVPK